MGRELLREVAHDLLFFFPVVPRPAVQVMAARRARGRRLDSALFPVQTEVLVEYNKERWPAVVLRRFGAKADVRYHPHGGITDATFENGVELSRLTYSVCLDDRGEAEEAEAQAEAQLALLLGPGPRPVPQAPADPPARSHTVLSFREATGKAWVTKMEADSRLSGWSFTFRITKKGSITKKFIDPAGETFRSLSSALASLARRVPCSAATAPSPTAAAASVVAAAAPAMARYAGVAPSASVLVDFDGRMWPATVLRCNAKKLSALTHTDSVDVRYWPQEGFSEPTFENGITMSRVELASVAEAEAAGARARVAKHAPPTAASPPKSPPKPHKFDDGREVHRDAQGNELSVIHCGHCQTINEITMKSSTKRQTITCSVCGITLKLKRARKMAQTPKPPKLKRARKMAQATPVHRGRLGKVSFFIYRYILHESCSQFDSLPLTSLLSRRTP